MPTDRARGQAETYREAAQERITCAAELYEGGRYVEANYFAGLAVECILRGFRMRIDPDFDSRHDVDRLYKLAKFTDVVPASETELIGGALGDVISLWSNDHRFLSHAALRQRWTKRGLYRGVRGDFVKERTRQLVNSALRIVNTGVTRWTVSKKN